MRFIPLTFISDVNPFFRCNVTQCDSPSSLYEESWLNFSIPYKNSAWDSCNRYVADESELSSDYCDAKYFSNTTETCGQDFKFRDEEKTISTEVSLRHFLEKRLILILARLMNSN